MARDYAPKTLSGIATAVAKDVSKKVGNRIAKDMTHQYVSVINAFYDDYHPTVYRRTYRSYYFADAGGVKAYTKFVKMDSDGKGFTVGLKLSPDNVLHPYTSLVNGKGTRSLTNLVFYNTWVLGQHGGRLPLSILPDDDKEKISAGNMRNWKPLKTTGWTWIPPVMAKSPMEMMVEWFDSYATEENLNKIMGDVTWRSIERYLRRWQTRYGT